MFDAERVWRVDRDSNIRSIRIAPSGTVLLNDRYLLHTDRASLSGIVDRPFKRRVDLDIVIAPWSHEWGSYGDYVLFVVAKLARIKETVDETTWAIARLCYPLRRKVWEGQYLTRLGFPEERIVDTRRRIRVSVNRLIIANGQSTLWLPSPSSLYALRRIFVDESRQPTPKRRFYLSRSNWSRKVRNEHAVRRLVRSFGLEVIDDMPPSLDDQIGLFREASLIVSPHGSALANLVWCEPGTRVIELFSRAYTVKHFAYVSHVLNLEYVYLVDESPKPNHWTNMNEDMHVDLGALELALRNATRSSACPPQSGQPS
jgi:capsular polysaccharide biosynthesis protein